MKTPTKEQLQAFMDHPEEIENVIEAFNDDTVEWLPYQIVLNLIEHKIWEPGETAIDFDQSKAIQLAALEVYPEHPEPDEYWYPNTVVRVFQRSAFEIGFKKALEIK